MSPNTKMLEETKELLGPPALMKAAADAMRLSEASHGKRLLVFTNGSRGDVQPFAALCTALQDAGFVVRVLTNVNHVPFFGSFGLDAVGVHVDSERWLKEDPAILEAMAKGDYFKMHVSLADMNKRLFPDVLRQQIEQARDFKPDLILASALESTQALAIAGMQGVPMMLGGLTAIHHTDNEPSMLGEPEWLPCWCFRLMNRLMSALWVSGEKDGKHGPLREQLPGCEPFLFQNVEQICYDQLNATVPRLYGVSPAVYLAGKNWPASVRGVFTGFWVVPRDEQERRMQGGDNAFGGGASDELQQFLEAGDTPVYIGWGSMLAVSREHMACLAVRALKLAGLRGVVLSGWAGLDADKLKGQPDSEELLAYASKRVLFVRTAAHEWLFPRCAAVVHHGGSGTTAASLRSGRPTIITPCAFDQFANSRMVQSAGAGLALPQISKVTPQQLAAALRRATTDVAMIKQASLVGDQLQNEDGLAAAVAAVDRFISQELVTGTWHRAATQGTQALRKLERPTFLQRLASFCKFMCE